MNVHQIFTAVIAAVVVGWSLHVQGWPLYAYLPAAILAALGTLVLWIGVWFAVRKLSYPYLARKRRKALRDDPPEDLDS